MSFTPGIPASGQSLGSSRTQVLNNFAVLRSSFAENHVDVNSANAGLHTFVELLSQSTDPNPSTGTVAHYSKQVSGATEWFFQRENSGAVIQMSSGIAGIPSALSNGQTFLPGGVILKWGNFSATTGGTTVTFSTAFPNNIFSVTLTSQINTNQSYDVHLKQAPTLTGFIGQTIIAGSVTTYYIAIGN